MSYLARHTALPVLSAALFAYLRFPYWTIAVLAALFTAFYLWLNSTALFQTRLVAAHSNSPPVVTLALVLFRVSVGLCFLAVQTLVYLAVLWLS
jgi:hypothetical protein